MNYNRLAQILDQAAKEAKPVAQLSQTTPLNLDQAYAIQSISIGRRYQRGEKQKGLKLGFTSKAKMEQMGVHDMIWGKLTDQMHYENGADLPLGNFIHPRAEPEIAFLLAKDITAKIDLENASDYIGGLAVAIEIIDSRYENFKFSLEDVVADNCSSAAFVLGPWQDPSTSYQDIPMSLLVDGEVVQAGSSRAILGNPLESLVAAARLGLENGENLSRGTLILAGAATSAVYIKQGQTIEARAQGFPSASIHVI